MTLVTPRDFPESLRVSVTSLWQIVTISHQFFSSFELARKEGPAVAGQILLPQHLEVHGHAGVGGVGREVGVGRKQPGRLVVAAVRQTEPQVKTG